MAKGKKKGQRVGQSAGVLATEVRSTFESAKTTVAGRPQELLRALKSDMYSEAYDDGRSFSNYLEELDPSFEHKNTKLDAFGRLVRASGIICATDASRGIYAHELDAFHKREETKVLIPELLARFWRRAVHGGTRAATYISTDQPTGGIMNPFAFAATPRTTGLVSPAIPLDEIVAMTTGIDRDTYKSFYLNHDVEQTRMKRVTEASDIPSAKLVGQDHTIKLHKYGRKLVTSYETLRRMPIDMVAFHLSRIAVQSEADKVTTAMGVLVAGDGNLNTAATVYNLTALDPSATPGTLTLRAWLAFKMLFANPYQLTTVLAQNTAALALQLLSTGSANIPLVFLQAQFGGFRPINPSLADGTALGWTLDAPANQLVGFDRRFAVERVFEIGANISEVGRYIENQTQVLTMTETEGYDILDAGGVKILNLAA